MLLNNQQITDEIKKEIKICIETNENERSNRGLKNYKQLKNDSTSSKKNISRTFSGGVMGSVGSVHFWIVP